MSGNNSPIIDGAPWIFIAVMGVTGAGKSTFIQTASGDDTVGIGHGLTSCTSDLKGYSFYHGGYNIILVDSPGFNDTYKSEAEVLGDIAAWLTESYEARTKLSGIIYVHSIKNERMEGSALRNLKMFRELCGDEPLKNVVLVTTFWDGVIKYVGEMREQELRTTPDFWGGMIRKGSRMARFEDRNSALEIILSLATKKPVTLEIQHELVEERKPLVKTAAGIIVNEELARLEEKYQKERGQLQQEMQDALKSRDLELQDILREQRQKMDRELERVHRQQEVLKAERRAERRRMESQLEDRFKQLQSQIDLRQNLTQDERTNRRLPIPHSNPRSNQQPVAPELELFNWLVSAIRANESKIPPEERVVLELKIEEVVKKHVPKDKPGPMKLQKKNISQFLIQTLQVALPVSTMALLGFPVTLPGGKGGYLSGPSSSGAELE